MFGEALAILKTMEIYRNILKEKNDRLDALIQALREFRDASDNPRMRKFLNFHIRDLKAIRYIKINPETGEVIGLDEIAAQEAAAQEAAEGGEVIIPEVMDEEAGVVEAPAEVEDEAPEDALVAAAEYHSIK